MRTRYYFFTLSAVVWALTGCVNDSLAPLGQGERLRGVFDADVAVTKAILVDNPGVKLESFWEAGEQIGVYGGNAENALFTLKAENLSYDRKTADFTTDGSIPSGKLLAYSPYQKDAGKSGDAIVVNFPSTQRYVTSDGVVQPDPGANILLGEGSKGTGLSFRNMTAVLKIGQAFETETLVKSVEFRDLSGASVSGAMKLTGGNHPKSEVSGSGKVLTLDLGEGIVFQAGAVSPLFLVVPAREYAKGFEITFIDDKGGRTVRTVGTTMGKTLERGVVYLIGDIAGENYEAETTSVLKPETILMTPEALDKILLLDRMNMPLTDPAGNPCYDQNGVPLYRPRLNLLVHKDLKLVVGGIWCSTSPRTTFLTAGFTKLRIARRKVTISTFWPARRSISPPRMRSFRSESRYSTKPVTCWRTAAWNWIWPATLSPSWTWRETIPFRSMRPKAVSSNSVTMRRPPCWDCLKPR